MNVEELKLTFSKNLNYWLKHRCKTQSNLSKIMGVSPATASDWCNGKKIPRTAKLVEISQWLMIDINDLLSDSTKTYSDIDALIYRIEDDDNFKSVVIDLYNFDKERYLKVLDYIELLKK